MSVGRNDPCPCGSGKKYKKCCMIADQAASDQLTPRILGRCCDEAVQALLAHARRLRGDSFLEDAWRAFWSGDDDEPFDPASSFLPLVIPWALYLRDPADVLEDGDVARENTVAVDFLGSPSASRLGERTRRFIEACRAEPLSFWQAEAVEPGVGMTMRDMVTGRECFIHERSASSTLVPYDIMFGQVVGVDGAHTLSMSGPYALPAALFRQRIEAFLAAEVDRAELFDRDQDLIDLYLDCVDDLLEPQRPELRNTEGDRLEWTTSTFRFDPDERGRLLGRLDQLRNIEAVPAEEEGTEQYIWVSQRQGGALEHTTRARIEVQADTLLTMCNSRKRDRLLRDRLRKRLGDLLDYEETAHEPMDWDAIDEFPDEGPESTSLDLDGLAPADRDRVQQMMDDIHMRWVDESVPALGGQTPREAVRTTAGRRAVEGLLNDFDNRKSHAPNPQDTFDNNRLRRQLGLDPE